MDVSVPDCILRATAKKPMSFWNHSLVHAQSGFESNRTRMELIVFSIGVYNTFVSSAGDHRTCVNERAHVVNVVVFPLIGIIDVAGFMVVFYGAIRWVVSVIDRGLFWRKKLIYGVIVNADKSDVCRYR